MQNGGGRIPIQSHPFLLFQYFYHFVYQTPVLPSAKPGFLDTLSRRGICPGGCQAVHTPKTVKIRFWAGFAAAVKPERSNTGPFPTFECKMKALSGDFDFPRKRKPAVPLYADGLRLLAFGAF